MEKVFLNVEDHFCLKLGSGESGNMPNMHFHNHYEIYILVDGHRRYIFEDEIVELEKNDIVLIPPHKIHATGRGKYKRYLMFFDDTYLKTYFTPKGINILLNSFQNRKFHVTDKEMNEITHAIETLSENEEAFPEFVKILQIINNTDGNNKFKCKSKTAVDIIEYVSQNYDKISNLNEVANQFYITKEHLCRIFKQNTGITIVKYINTKKILKACDLLTLTEMTTEEVAINSGFSSSEYFCRTFKNIIGNTPREYRKLKKDM